jgi:hypothetical protein
MLYKRWCSVSFKSRHMSQASTGLSLYGRRARA